MSLPPSPSLPGQREYCIPELALRGKAFADAGGDGQGDMGQLIEPEADEQVGLTGHGRVGCLAGELVAKQAVGRSCWDTANMIAGVKVDDFNRHGLGREVFAHLLLEERSDIGQLSIPRSVMGFLGAGQQMLAGSLGNYHHGVISSFHATLELG